MIITKIAAAVALSGVVILLTSGRGSHSAASHTQHATGGYQAAGMEVRVDTWGWMSHDMFGGPPPSENHFPMPQSMMPGIQADDVNRLRVELTVINRGARAAQLSHDDFQVESANGGRWGVNPGMLTTANVLSETSLSVDLYFDVPLNETVRDIVFAKGGDAVQIPFTGPAPQHEHGY